MPTRRTMVALIGTVGLAGCNGVLGGTSDSRSTDDGFDLQPTETPVGTATPTEAGPTVVEDFESGTLESYEGDLGGFAVTTNEAYEGEAMLVADNPTSEGYDIWRFSGPTPSVGNRFRFNVNLGRGGGEGADLRMYFAVQDSAHWYGVNVGRGDLPGITLHKDHEVISNDPADIPRDRWLEVEVSWSDEGPTTAQVYDPEDTDRVYATTAAQLDEYDSGGIGWRALDATAQPRYADAVRIVNSGE